MAAKLVYGSHQICSSFQDFQDFDGETEEELESVELEELEESEERETPLPWEHVQNVKS